MGLGSFLKRSALAPIRATGQLVAGKPLQATQAVFGAQRRAPQAAPPMNIAPQLMQGLAQRFRKPGGLFQR